MRAGKLVLTFLKKYWIRYVLGIFVVIISTFSITIIPKYIGMAIDKLNVKVIDVAGVQNIALIIAGVGIIAFLSRILWRYLIFGFSRHIEFLLRDYLFRHLQMLSADFYIKNNTGNIITRAIVDVQAVRMMLGFAFVGMIDAMVTTAMSITNMSTSMSPAVTLLAISPVPFITFVIIKVRLMVQKRYSKVQDAISDISSKIQENITGIRVIKAFAQEMQETEVFGQLSVKKVDAETDLAKASALIGPSVQITFGIIFSVFLVIGGGMVAKGSITLGDYVVFNTYLMLIMGPVSNVGRIVERWQRGVVSLHRLDKILLEKPTIDDTKADMSITEFETGSIEARNLSFAYKEGCDVLKNISFHIPSGGILAIMGATGCGKSTLIGLLMRNWACRSGMLYVDGMDINIIPLKILRGNCAYVPQETFLFSDTIRENIRFYDPCISDDQVYAAAGAAHVHDDITEFPLGYDTVVGERGMTLSGGQKQRIALARALVRKPRVLLLDDCMSAVDSNTEKDIIESLKEQIAGCTAIIVTHRLSAAALADRVLLLDVDGSMAEIGSHEELIQQKNAYAQMFEAIRKEEELMMEEGGIDA